MKSFVIRLVVVTSGLLFAAAGEPALAAPDGTMTWGVHVTLAARWLDPSDTEAFITPFMVLYALHDALVKPMPGGDNTPSLAESWTTSKDGLSYEFVLRKGEVPQRRSGHRGRRQVLLRALPRRGGQAAEGSCAGGADR